MLYYQDTEFLVIRSFFFWSRHKYVISRTVAMYGGSDSRAFSSSVGDWGSILGRDGPKSLKEVVAVPLADFVCLVYGRPLSQLVAYERRA